MQPELPLLIRKGYLTEFCKLTDNCKVLRGEGSGMVRIPPQTDRLSLEISNEQEDKGEKKEKEWRAGRELNTRPPPCQG